ncbi:MAG: hypothetical protein ACLSTO_11450 [Bilophila wadsworthia]
MHDQCVRAPTSTQASLWNLGTTPRRASATASIKKGCKGPTTYNACPITRWNNRVSIPSSPATAASAVPNRTSGITVPSTAASPTFPNSEPTRLPKPWAWPPSPASVPAW